MRTPNNPKKYEHEYYRDADGKAHYVEQIIVTRDKNANSYRHGYIQGRAAEKVRQYDLSKRDSENTARGLLVGALLASVAVLAGAYAWYISQPESSISPVSPNVISVPEKERPLPIPQ